MQNDLSPRERVSRDRDSRLSQTSNTSDNDWFFFFFFFLILWEKVLLVRRARACVCVCVYVLFFFRGVCVQTVGLFLWGKNIRSPVFNDVPPMGSFNPGSFSVKEKKNIIIFFFNGVFLSS